MLKKAFTLAEVLLAMSIVGIVAALTVPNFISNTDEEKTVVKLKKINKELNDAYTQTLFKYGDYNNWSSESSSEKAERLFEFLDVSVGNSSSFPNSSINSTFTKCELRDGTKVSVSNDNVFVALNGMSGKTFGRDIFGFKINRTDGSIEPMDKDHDVGANNKLSFTDSNYVYGTRWAIVKGNLDYWRCLDNLTWNGTTTCK